MPDTIPTSVTAERLLAMLLSERADIVRQLKRTQGRHGEGRYLDRLDRQIAAARAAVASKEG